MIEKKRTYTWELSIPDYKVISERKRVSSKVFHDCDIVVSLKGTRDDCDGATFDIIIETTNFTAVSAHILLNLSNFNEEQKLFTDLEDSPCIFSEWSVPDCDFDDERTYNFICQITWMITVPIPRPHFNWNNIKKFLMSPSYCDLKIVIGTEELHAHKIVLASHSNVFDTMLSAPMKEAAENKIIVKDIRLDVMKTVLAFLYAGEEEALDDLQMALSCLETAEKYEIQDLKEFCEYKLCQYITADNVVAILSDADTFRAEKLKRECLMFVAENKAAIVPTTGFQEMWVARPHLMVQFMEALTIDP